MNLAGSEMIRRAEIVRDWFRVREGVRGSGWHDQDRNPSAPDLYLAPQMNGLPKASTNAIYFAEEYRTIYAGQDVARIEKAFADHCEKIMALGWQNANPQQLNRLKRLPTLKPTTAEDGTPLFVFPRQLHVFVINVLEDEGIRVSGSWDEYPS